MSEFFRKLRDAFCDRPEEFLGDVLALLCIVVLGISTFYLLPIIGVIIGVEP